jgi:hypothetical protein
MTKEQELKLKLEELNSYRTQRQLGYGMIDSQLNLLYDDIKAGKAPGMTSIDVLFEDDIHLNAMGNYAVTMLVYAVIYQRNPKELPDRLAEEDRVMSSAQARYFKDVAWKVARSYDRAGLPG